MREGGGMLLCGCKVVGDVAANPTMTPPAPDLCHKVVGWRFKHLW